MSKLLGVFFVFHCNFFVTLASPIILNKPSETSFESFCSFFTMFRKRLLTLLSAEKTQINLVFRSLISNFATDYE